MSVVGLDFGAQNALLAAAGRGGVDVILNGNSQRLNPSMVGFSESRSMGESASSTATSNYKNTIINMKRLLGLSFHDPRAQAEMKQVFFKCVPIKRECGGPDSIGVQVSFDNEDIVVSIEAVAGMMVKHMGGIAAANTASSSAADILSAGNKNASILDPESKLFPRDWVIAVPGYYTDAQKRALLTGCEISGVKGVQRLMNENTATALAYGIFKDIRKEFTKDKAIDVMFIDMGATAYSVTIVAFEPGKLSVRSAHYDPDLGGRNFDRVIAEWVSKHFEAKYNGTLSGKPLEQPKVLLKLLANAEKTKKTLSPTGVREARLNIESLMDDHDFAATLKADEYEKLCAPLLDRLSGPIQRCLEETKMKPSDLSSVEIVGGSTRIGCVKRALSKILGLHESATNNGLSTTMNADESVARGAALQSAILSPRFKVLPYEIVEAQTYPIKIGWDSEATGTAQDGVEIKEHTKDSDIPPTSVVMFERGSNYPCVRRVTLRKAGEFAVTASYDESALEYNYLAGSSLDIATFKIKAPPGEENKIRVNVKADISGTILLSSAQMVEDLPDDETMADAKEGSESKNREDAKVEQKKKIKKTILDFSERRPLEWSKSEIEKAFEAEVSMTNADRVVRETSDMRNELESYIYDMRDKILSQSYLSQFGTDEEKAAFSSELESTESWLYEEGFDATKSSYAERLEALKKLGDPIEFRHAENAARPNAIAILQRSVAKYNDWLNAASHEEKYNHITEGEMEKCHSACDEISGWMYEMMDEQGSLPLHANPAVTVAQIHAKSQDLSNVINPVMHKPRPKPKPEETKTPEEAKLPEETQTDEGAAPMESSNADDPVPMETK